MSTEKYQSAWPSSYCLTDEHGMERERDFRRALKRGIPPGFAEALGLNDAAHMTSQHRRNPMSTEPQTSAERRWIRCDDQLPPDAEVVMTKIDNANGVRNEQPLKRQGRLWFFADGSMYVYYTPTHWTTP